MGSGHAGALKRKFRAETVRRRLDFIQHPVEIRIFREVECMDGSESLCDFQTVVVSVQRYDVLNAEGADHCHYHQADRTAALNRNCRIEFPRSGCPGTFHRVNRDSRRLHKHSLVKCHSCDVEEGRSPADHRVRCKISVQMNVVIRKKPVNAAVLTQIGPRRRTLQAEHFPQGMMHVTSLSRGFTALIGI